MGGAPHPRVGTKLAEVLLYSGSDGEHDEVEDTEEDEVCYAAIARWAENVATAISLWGPAPIM
jgi:hypothetical protein